ncbi:MAG: outer membrane beta-barrel protein [Flavobacteriaceae bacterium]
MKKIFTLLLASFTAIAVAQEDAPALSISGTVDAYFQTNLSAPDDAGQSFGTSFADETGFALGMANLVAAYDMGSTGVVADVVFGPRGDAAVGGYNLNQLYAYWNVNETTTLTMGRWNTYLGYEVISPAGNFNYSTSYMFSSGPFSMVGLKADFALSDDFSLMLAVMNPTDVNNNTIGGYSLGAQLGYKGQYLNLYADDDEVLGFEIDYTGGFDLSDDVFLGINAAYQTMEDAGFYGVALYPQYTVSDSFALGLRGELFGYHDDTDDDLPSVFATTITGSYSVENLTIKPEIRMDAWSESEPYLDNDGLVGG